MRRLLAGLAVSGLVVGTCATARADVRIEYGANSFGAQLQGAGHYRVVVEHFADGSRNGIRFRQVGFGDPRIFSDDPEDCTYNPAFNDVVCNGIASLIQMTVEDAAQEIVIGGSAVGCEPAAAETTLLLATAGGDDIVRPSFHCGGQENVVGNNRLSPRFVGGLGSGDDRLTGGRLNDDVEGGSGADVMSGGTGDDELDGGDGNDTIRGNGGDDLLIGGLFDDVLDGDGGTDTVRYDGVTSALNISIDGNDNDGRSGERDNVQEVEVVIGGPAGDTLGGSSAGETFDGGPGNDTIRPGAGADTVRGNAGDDLIDVRENNEGIRDSVTCGVGFDSVIADLADNVVGRAPISSPKDDACERIERFAVDDGPPAQIRARTLRVGAGRTLAVRLTCPRRARVDCRGALRLVDSTRFSRTLARKRYAVARRGAATVTLRLSGAEVRDVRARGAVTAITRERGVSKKGPRSTTATFSIG